jgi:hypothetical protein
VLTRQAMARAYPEALVGASADRIVGLSPLEAMDLASSGASATAQTVLTDDGRLRVCGTRGGRACAEDKRLDGRRRSSAGDQCLGYAGQLTDRLRQTGVVPQATNMAS